MYEQKKPSIIFLSIFILIGLLISWLGISDAYRVMNKTKDYVPIKATFASSSAYSTDEDGTTYTLTYVYFVDGKSYTVSTNYGTSIVPKIGTIKTIKYNPNNPSEAVIAGFGSYAVLIVIGIMFIIIPIIIAIAPRPNLTTETKSKIYGILTGSIFALVGVGTYYLMCSGGDSLSIIDAFKSAGLWVLIPLLFVASGTWVVITNVLPLKKKKYESNSENKLSDEPNTESIESIQNEERILDAGEKIVKGIGFVVPAYQIVAGAIFTGICFWIFIQAADTFSRIVIVPFLICGLAVLIRSVVLFINSVNLKNNQNLETNLNKINYLAKNIYIISFLVFWFGFLIVFDYAAIKQYNQGGLILLLFSLIFWAAGIWVAYKNFKRK